MKILVTGAEGFVGRNLCAALKNEKHTVFAVGRNDDLQTLTHACAQAEFVFHLAGVNRAATREAFWQGNVELTQTLLDTLAQCENPCPLMFASSVQAALVGDFNGDYAASKREAEKRVLRYGVRTGASVRIYRLPNLFGKWGRPYYNSVVATFCHCAANDLALPPYREETTLELLHIDDLLKQLCGALHEPDGGYRTVTGTHTVTLGRIARLLREFDACERRAVMPETAENSFERKLYTTYLSYLPEGRICTPCDGHIDARGSFTELLRTPHCGQLSVNVCRPNCVRGGHWHGHKWETFTVVSGEGKIRLRKLGTRRVLEFAVSGEKMQTVRILPGYVHELVNTAQEDMITLIWAGEVFDPREPDTFYEAVDV